MIDWEDTKERVKNPAGIILQSIGLSCIMLLWKSQGSRDNTSQDISVLALPENKLFKLAFELLILLYDNDFH